MPDASIARPRPVGVALSTAYLPELESLRGIAMLLVLCFHLNSKVEGPLLRVGGVVVSPALAYVSAGHAGVNLFFVLSAFLLSSPFLVQAAGGPRVSVTRYFGRRALRILPLYYTAVIAATILSATAASDLLRALPYLLFLNGFAGMTTPLPPYSSVWWSLATEAQFYLLLPLLPLALGSRRARLISIGALGLWAAAYAGYLAGTWRVSSDSGQLLLGLSLFGRFPLFLAGIGAAWLYLQRGEALRERLAALPVMRRGGADLLLMFVLIALGYLLRWIVWIGARLEWGPPYNAWHVPESLLWATLLLLLLIAPLRLKPLLSNRVLNQLGVLSYSLYVLHLPVFTFGLSVLRSRWPSLVGWNPQTWAAAGLLCLLCVGLSEMTYRCIERPFLVRKERLRPTMPTALYAVPGEESGKVRRPPAFDRP